MRAEAVTFVNGATFLACCAIAVYFVRFWKATGDRLFALFGLAFAVFAANRIALLFVPDDAEARTFLYMVRAAAFAVILVAIVDKNRSGGGGRARDDGIIE